MKKTLLLMAVIGGMLLSLQAQAQHYLVADVGIIASDGSNSAAYKQSIESGINVTRNDSDVTHEGNPLRVAYGYQFNEKTSMEIGHNILGEATFKSDYEYEYDYDYTDVGGTAGTESYSPSNEAKLSATAIDVSALYHHSLNDTVTLLARAGIASYKWKLETEGKLDDTDTTSGNTLLLGFGAQFGKIRAEYGLYDLTYIFVDTYNNNKETEFYGTAGVLSVGYKYEF